MIVNYKKYFEIPSLIKVNDSGNKCPETNNKIQAEGSEKVILNIYGEI